MSEHEIEPVRGLPAPLPAGERILWQGEPCWRGLALRTFHVRKIAIYCAVLLAWRVVSDLYDGLGPAGAAASTVWILPLTVLAIGLPALLAWLYARTTIFTITTHRVVMRFGVALSMSINIPFRVIAAAGLRTYRDHTGDIPLALTGDDRFAWLHLWPYVRPWRLTKAEPMLRAVPDAGDVAEILAQALAAGAAVAPAPMPAATTRRLASAA